LPVILDEDAYGTGVALVRDRYLDNELQFHRVD
jgi:hypothetical protein